MGDPGFWIIRSSREADGTAKQRDSTTQGLQTVGLCFEAPHHPLPQPGGWRDQWAVIEAVRSPKGPKIFLSLSCPPNRLLSLLKGKPVHCPITLCFSCRKNNKVEGMKLMLRPAKAPVPVNSQARLLVCGLPISLLEDLPPTLQAVFTI